MSKNDKETLALMKADVVDVVSNRVRGMISNGQLHLPENYSAENALKSAWLKLQETVDKDRNPVLRSCTKDSIANSLLDMIVQGLNCAKNQCYFIAYGKTLICQRSYFGDMHLVKQIKPEAEIYYSVIYQGDELEYEIRRGTKVITKHIQKIENIGGLDKIVGAYCVIELPEQLPQTTIMTIDQIKKSWEKSKTYGKTKGTTFHDDQPDEACLRTVVRRACKPIINSSNDEHLLRSVVRSDLESADAEIEEEAAAEEHQQVIDIDPPEAEEAASQEAETDAQESEEEPEPVAAGGGPGF